MTHNKGLKVIVVISLLLIIGVGVLLGFDSPWGRQVRGISEIVVMNKADCPLLNVHICFSSTGTGLVCQSFEFIDPGESVSIVVCTSDLVFDHLDYTMNGNEHSYTDGGIACPGEKLVLDVKAPGQVDSHYSR